MKRLSVFSLLLCLAIGFLVGIISPTPWSSTKEVGLSPISPGTISTLSVASDISGTTPMSPAAADPLDPSDNVPLLRAACAVVQTLKEQNYETLATLVHPTRGVTFTPYSTVNFETNLTFLPNQIRTLVSDKTVYKWGAVDGRGTLIELTFPQYMAQYVYHADYTQATQIGVDQIIVSGNALENLREEYPGCRFVDFAFPATDPDSQGLDWCSLKLVFAPGESSWLLVGIIHAQWTA